jgi:copper chaperone
MSCQHCVMAITKALSNIDGLENIKVDLETGTATFDETHPVAMDVIKERIEETGYELG